MDGLSDPVSAAFHAMAREEFLPPAARGHARYDGPVPIGHGQTCSQPRTVAAMLRLLDVRPGHRVLDVGAGSGWTTALLGHLVGADGSVVGVELVAELAASAEVNVRRTSGPWATVRKAAEGVLGVPEEGPYDRILVSADSGEVPQTLLDQLGDPGRMVLPAAGVMTVVARVDGEDRVSRHGRYRFVPLVRPAIGPA